MDLATPHVWAATATAAELRALPPAALWRWASAIAEWVLVLQALEEAPHNLALGLLIGRRQWLANGDDLAEIRSAAVDHFAAELHRNFMASWRREYSVLCATKDVVDGLASDDPQAADRLAWKATRLAVLLALHRELTCTAPRAIQVEANRVADAHVREMLGYVLAVEVV